MTRFFVRTIVSAFVIACCILLTAACAPLSANGQMTASTGLASADELGQLHVGEGHSINSATDVRSLSGADILWLLNHPEQVVVEEPAKKGVPSRSDWNHDKRNWIFLDICNGKLAPGSVPGVLGGNGGACDMIVSFYTQFDKILSTDPRTFETLVRECYWAATTNDAKKGCGDLAVHLLRIGNFQAGKAVLKYAPGCHTKDYPFSNPANGCWNIASQSVRLKTDPHVGDAFGLEGDIVIPGSDEFRAGLATITHEDLLYIVEPACNHDLQYEACLFAKEQGGRIRFNDEQLSELADLQRQHSEKLHEWAQEGWAETMRVSDERREEAENRTNTLRNLANSISPTMVLDTANQQGAQMVAIGAANDAARRRATLAAQTPSPSTQGAPRPLATTTPQSTGPSGRTAGIDGSSSAAGVGDTDSPSGNKGVYADALASSCVALFRDAKYYNWISFQNNCGQAIYFEYGFSNGKYGILGGEHLAPGASGNSGRSEDEINAQGGYLLLVCPDGFNPVDPSTDNPISQVGPFVCKKL